MPKKVPPAALAAWLEKQAAEKAAARWSSDDGLCPRCLAPDRHDDGGFPLRRRWCDACGFEYTLWLDTTTRRPSAKDHPQGSLF
jgi:hypothetical protein